MQIKPEGKDVIFLKKSIYLIQIMTTYQKFYIERYYADYRPEENVIVIEYYGRFNIIENNVLTRILEGNELYREERLEDETGKESYSFRDNGAMYCMVSFLNVETGEWSEPIVASAYERIKEDESKIKVIISRIKGEFQMVKINADGTLDFIDE